jgi:hypothetical protein
MFDMVIAQCPKCGQQYFGDTEETVRQKYRGHVCFSQISEEELREKIGNIIIRKEKDE